MMPLIILEGGHPRWEVNLTFKTHLFLFPQGLFFSFFFCYVETAYLSGKAQNAHLKLFQVARCEKHRINVNFPRMQKKMGSNCERLNLVFM